MSTALACAVTGTPRDVTYAYGTTSARIAHPSMSTTERG